MKKKLGRKKQKREKESLAVDDAGQPCRGARIQVSARRLGLTATGKGLFVFLPPEPFDPRPSLVLV